MGQLMHDALGIGLAATQVGLMHRVLVYRVEADGPIAALVNPRARVGRARSASRWRRAASACPACWSRSSARCTCASAPRTSAARTILIEASGLEARVIQHEMDHLDGVLILDRTSREQRKEAMRTLRETAPAPLGASA